MKFLPFEKTTFKTKLKKDEVIKRLSNIIIKEKLLWFGLLARVENGSTGTYEGKINENKFIIKRIMTGRRVPPIIKGIIQEDFAGTTIFIKIQQKIEVYIFFFLYIAFAGFMGVFVLIQDLKAKEFQPHFLFPFGLIIFIYIVTINAFNAESNKSKKELQTLFDAEILDGL